MRILIPKLRKRYTALGREVERKLREWYAHVTMAQTESDLSADVGYLHTQHLQQVWRRVSRRLAASVAQRVFLGLQRGETQDQMEQAVAQILGQALAGYELERIVRTETTRYYNYAIIYETAAYPDVAGYRYEVVIDDRTSDICQSVAGKTVRREQLRIAPPLHPNCRTVLVPLLAEDMQEPTLVLEHVPARAQLFGLIPRTLQQRLLSPASVQPSLQFWAAWQAHEPSIRRLCHSFARGDETQGQDLYADTMLRAYERYALYDPTRSTFIGWVYRIARSIAYNRHRIAQREVALADLDSMSIY